MYYTNATADTATTLSPVVQNPYTVITPKRKALYMPPPPRKANFFPLKSASDATGASTSPGTKNIPPSSNPPKKNMIWGEPTWLFFHTLAHKVKEEDFSSIRSELLQLFYGICANLPCPECASHAMSYLNNVNFQAIQTKRQLKDLFFHFHNVANEKKHIPLFKYEDLDEKYSKAITINIIQNFLFHFLNKSANHKMMANELHRSRVVLKIKEWLNNNIQHFEA